MSLQPDSHARFFHKFITLGLCLLLLNPLATPVTASENTSIFSFESSQPETAAGGDSSDENPGFILSAIDHHSLEPHSPLTPVNSEAEHAQGDSSDLPPEAAFLTQRSNGVYEMLMDDYFQVLLDELLPPELTADFTAAELVNVELAALRQRLYEGLAGLYDFVVLVPTELAYGALENFNSLLPPGVSGLPGFGVPEKDNIEGIGFPEDDPTVDRLNETFGPLFQELFSPFMGAVRNAGIHQGSVWLDPNAIEEGGFYTGLEYHLSVLLQELHHRWGTHLSSGGTGDGNPLGLLGRDNSHWSPFLDAGNSPMDGIDWTDNGNGTFRLERIYGVDYDDFVNFLLGGSSDVPVTSVYNDFDLYAMGLLAPSEVDSSYVIASPTFSDGTPVSSENFLNEIVNRMANDFDFFLNPTIHGARDNVTIDDIIAIEGARSPTSAQSQQNFSVGFVIVKNESDTSSTVQNVVNLLNPVASNIANAWNAATSGLSSLTLGPMAGAFDFFRDIVLSIFDEVVEIIETDREPAFLTEQDRAQQQLVELGTLEGLLSDAQEIVDALETAAASDSELAEELGDLPDQLDAITATLAALRSGLEDALARAAAVADLIAAERSNTGDDTDQSEADGILPVGFGRTTEGRLDGIDGEYADATTQLDTASDDFEAQQDVLLAQLNSILDSAVGIVIVHATAVVNNNAPYTRLRDVTVQLSFLADISEYAEMSFAINKTNDSAYSPWQTTAAAKALKLPNYQGTNYVNVRIRGRGTKVWVWDSIFLDSVKPAVAMILGNGSGYTNSRQLNVHLDASDSGSGLSQMSYSINNSSPSAYSPWEDFSEDKIITLPKYEETHYVNFAVKDAAGNVTYLWKSIVYDRTRPALSVSVNGGDSVTNSRTVTVALDASDDRSGLFEMSFAINRTNEASYSAWETFADTKTLTLPNYESTNYVNVRIRDRALNVKFAYDAIVLDTTAPAISAVSITEGATVDIPYLAVSYQVTEGGITTFKYQEADLAEGSNTIEIVETDAAGNEAHVTRHINYVPTDKLEEEWQALRERYIRENALYFQEGQGIDDATGFPLDVIGTNAPEEVTWTQPTSIGFYLQFLTEVITKRYPMDFLEHAPAIEQAEKVVANLLQVQSDWGWGGLIPWLKLTPVFEPDSDHVALIDNANLSHSLAIVSGALLRSNLHTTRLKTLYDNIQAFLANQQEGYAALVDPDSGFFYATYDIGDAELNGAVDRFGSEIRGTIPFLISYYGLSSSVWDNLIRSVSQYTISDGTVVETFSAFDGGGFQYFWPLLGTPEESLPNISGALLDALLIHSDFQARTNLPGFASASSLPEGGYSGQIGISDLKENPASVDETVGSLYSLAAAYRLDPEFVLGRIQEIEAAFPSLIGPLGFYDSARSNDEVSQNYYAIDQGALVLGLAGHGADDFKIWMQAEGVWEDYQGFYEALDIGISSQ